MSERRIAAPSRESGPTETGRTYVAGGAALGGAAVLAAFNLRPAISSVGPLLEEVRHGLGMSPTVAGALTSLPALCFAIAGTGAPRLARRLGTDVVVAAAMVVLAAGLALRPIVGGGEIGFLAFSAVALAGIGVANVVMPALVKRHFPDRIGAFTGLYSMALTFGAAVAAAVSVPLANRFGGSWRVSLALWAIDCVGPGCVLHLAAAQLAALQRKSGLLARPAHDERQPQGFASQRGVKRVDLDVGLRKRLTARLQLAHDAGSVTNIEHGLAEHLPVGVARVRIVGVLDRHGPAIAQAVLDLARDLGIRQVGQE